MSCHDNQKHPAGRLESGVSEPISASTLISLRGVDRDQQPEFTGLTFATADTKGTMGFQLFKIFVVRRDLSGSVVELEPQGA